MPQIEKDLMTELFEIQGYRALQIVKYRHEGYIDIFLESITPPKGCLFPHTRYAKGLGRLVVRYTCFFDNRAAAGLLGFSESTFFRIEKTELEEMLSRYRGNIPPTETLSIDEVSFNRRHNYTTIVTDFDAGKGVWLEKDRLNNSLMKAYKELETKGIKQVAMNFWRAYERATLQEIPQAMIIFDKFHLARILNRKVEEERRYYQSQLPKEEQSDIKKNFRWIILKRRHNMTDVKVLQKCGILMDYATHT